jgi:hypothetical protein
VPQNNNVPVVTLNSHNKAATKPSGTNTSTPAARAMTKRTATTAASAPKLIWVNDKVAKRNFDGRLYYDLKGKRYWKNYVDGKYYLFTKAMYTNKAFKPR